MISFNELSSLEINHKHISIRRYQTSDFDGINEIFQVEFFQWYYTNYTNCLEFINEKLHKFNMQESIMFVIIDNHTNKIIGTTSLYDISFKHKRLELGSTWFAKDYQGRHYNALSKYLFIDVLINYCKFNRLQWKTDSLNTKSQNAMTKLGLIYEGTLHRHIVTHSGRIRDSVFFAVTDLTWVNVKQNIIKRIQDKLDKTQDYKEVELNYILNKNEE